MEIFSSIIINGLVLFGGLCADFVVDRIVGYVFLDPVSSTGYDVGVCGMTLEFTG